MNKLILKKERHTSFRINIAIWLFAILLSLFFSQTASATMYQPGQTLEPDCAPGSANCGVNVTNLGTSDLTLTGVRTLNLNGYALTLDGTLDTVFSNNGDVTIGGNLTIAGNKLFLGTNTLGSILVADGTNFNPIVLSGDATIDPSGTLLINYNAAQSANALNKGFLTSADWTTFNSKLSSINNSNWSGTELSVLNGGTGTTNGSITGLGALSFISDTVNALTLDSGTIGAINIGTNSNAKTITVGNTTGATTLNLQSGTGNINLLVASASVTGSVQIGTGGSGSATPDLLAIDVKNTAGDPAGINGAIYYNANTGKFRCFENGAWANCITPPGGDLQQATSYDTNEALTNIPTGGAQVLLGIVSVTPANASGDVYVTGWADVYSGNGTDQPLQIAIETTANCTGSTVGNASVTYTITSGASTSNDRGTIRVSGIEIDAGASAHPYSLCAAVTSGGGDSDILNWGIEALVIDTGADFAEIYTTNDESLEAGDVVSLDENLKTGIKKSENSNDQNVLGIVSTRPGMLIGDVEKEGVKALPVALSGRVPVKVITENGVIKSGDYLVSSSTPGVAMKAGNTGRVIAQVISAYNGEGIGTVMAFVKNFNLGEKETSKSRTKQICLETSDGNEICVNGDQLNKILQNNTAPEDPVSVQPSVIVPEQIPATVTPDEIPTTTPEINPPLNELAPADEPVPTDQSQDLAQ